MDTRMNVFESRFMETMKDMDQLYEDYARAQGLTYTSFAVLECICMQQDFCTQKTICEELHYPKQSVNVVVKGLLEKGFVELKELPEDRRNKRITLTAAGEAFAEEIVQPFWTAGEAAEEALSEGERAELLRLLEVYTRALREKLIR